MLKKYSRGFSLVEILLVLAILGILAGIAIPTYLGQRRRARVIGDAMSNAQVMRMQLEARKADTGSYGNPAVSYTWIKNGLGGYTASDPTLVPSFVPSGSSDMEFQVDVDVSGLAYVLSVWEPKLGAGLVYQTNQNGQQIFRLN